jgi:mevalonate kinase
LSLVTNEFTQATNQSIEYLMIGDKAEFFKTLSTLSSLQLNHFSEMILPNIVEFWMGGLKSNEYYLKLCGAGGGGYVIGFARDKKTIDEIKGIFHENLIEVEQ